MQEKGNSWEVKLFNDFGSWLKSRNTHLLFLTVFILALNVWYDLGEVPLLVAVWCLGFSTAISVLEIIGE